jgi:NAD(P)-dependent dehydrogenase (short-subunit alcohol dehydrogenase family)
MTQPPQQQTPPGKESKLRPKADHGEQSYKGSGRLEGKAAVITGADSGIGRAVAIAFAREGADVLVSYLCEHDDAKETARWVEQAGRKAVLIAGDLADPAHCRAVIDRAAKEFGRIDILVNNAAFQMEHDSLEETPDEEIEHTFRVNILSFFYLCKAALKHMKKGGSIVNTASVVADQPREKLLPYSATKAAIVNFSGGLSKLLSGKGIRVNCVAPGPIWTPLIPSTMSPEHVARFGGNTPMERPGQPGEVAPAYVFLASDESSYVSGARIAVTGGVPII